MKTELFLIPMANVPKNGEDTLSVLVIDDPRHNGLSVFPHTVLRQDFHIHSGIYHILCQYLTEVNRTMFEDWFQSSRRQDRIVDVYDRDLLFEQIKSIAIVKAIAIPQDFSKGVKGAKWVEAESLFSPDSVLSVDCRLFLRECLNQVPFWVRNTSFIFELLLKIFSIQELRLLVSALSKQEIDPGNFHRRLKKLDILNPLVKGQRVHRWEFAWEKRDVLAADGLIP